MIRMTVNGSSVESPTTFEAVNPATGEVEAQAPDRTNEQLDAALLPTMQFGGSRWSGVGVENGVDGLLAFTEQQVVQTARA
ncbi:MAG: betaine-aldehyde dehydrogenase [Massilia sp.]|jgi:acyl-CoA reductase-like NAD-dependent aldehyde dehydrogenase|nr:betaine-aldehyde dehydrogenase [Gemmatimonadales bacterium]MDB5910839.1 betaine-aldehyde dehydrogenase [Massilia sp.]